jgi:hypothetical protein
VGRGSRNTPTGYGSRGLGVGSALAGIPPSTQDECRHARLLGRKLKAARGGQAKPRDLGDDARESFVPKPLLGGGQNLRLAMCLGIDDAIRMQTHGCESRCEEIAAPDAPQNRAFVARQDAGNEQRRRCRMLARNPGLHNLVERVEGEPAAGKMAVNGTHSEWKRLARASTAFKPPNALA